MSAGRFPPAPARRGALTRESEGMADHGAVHAGQLFWLQAQATRRPRCHPVIQPVADAVSDLATTRRRSATSTPLRPRFSTAAFVRMADRPETGKTSVSTGRARENKAAGSGSPETKRHRLEWPVVVRDVLVLRRTS